MLCRVCGGSILDGTVALRVAWLHGLLFRCISFVMRDSGGREPGMITWIADYTTDGWI